MKKISAFFIICAAVLGLTACSQNAAPVEATEGIQTISITHSLGTTDNIPYDPQKVAVLDLAALDIVDALGMGERVVGIPKKSSVHYLTAYNENEEIINLGSVKEVDMEALNSLEPDLIIIGGRLAEEYDRLSKIAPTISVTIEHEEGYINSFKENVENIASLFGLEEKSKSFFTDFENRIQILKEAAAEKTAIVGLVTSSSLSTLGNTSRCSMIVNEIGFFNAASDVNSTHGDSSSFELLLQKNPDYLFILDRDTAINSEGAKTAKEVIENEIVQKTSAYQEGNIIYLTPDVWYLSEGGITATDTMLKDLEARILK